MRTQYQRRSWSSVFIWMTALCSIIAVAAWQFDWWPTADIDLSGLSPGLRDSKPPKPPKPTIRQVQHESGEHGVFSHQAEPELPPPAEIPPFDPNDRPDFSGFPSPPRLLPANPDAKPIPVPSRLVQTVEGELPAPNPTELAGDFPSPTEFTPDPSIQLLADETPQPTPAAESSVNPFAEPSAAPFPPATPQPAALPPGMESVADTMQQIDAWLKSGTPKEELLAHKELSTLYWDHPEWREAIRERIEKTAKSIYFAKQPHYMTPYMVQPGDQLTKIGNLYKVPWQYLASLNKVDPRKVRVGQKLKVIKGPFAAVVDLHRFELTIQHHGFFVKRYKVGIGKDGTSPIGEFAIRNKLTNPTYYGPDGVIQADDPKNPLGEYWIDIGDSYGIHGTVDPDSIGKAESRGCIRMLNDDAAEVYGFLGIGAKVIIRR